MPGRIVRRARTCRNIGGWFTETGSHSCRAVVKDLLFLAFVLLSIAACAAYFGPFGPTGQPDPTIIQTVPRPDYFFPMDLWCLSLLHRRARTAGDLIGPVIALVGAPGASFFLRGG
jgi:ubiquinol-cytochrome c reductase cytochrome b subunit